MNFVNFQHFILQELYGRWKQYVNSHLEFENLMRETNDWLEGIASKLEYCSDLSASNQTDLEGKLTTIQVR